MEEVPVEGSPTPPYRFLQKAGVLLPHLHLVLQLSLACDLVLPDDLQAVAGEVAAERSVDVDIGAGFGDLDVTARTGPGLYFHGEDVVDPGNHLSLHVRYFSEDNLVAAACQAGQLLHSLGRHHLDVRADGGGGGTASTDPASPRGSTWQCGDVNQTTRPARAITATLELALAPGAEIVFISLTAAVEELLAGLGLFVEEPARHGRPTRPVVLLLLAGVSHVQVQASTGPGQFLGLNTGVAAGSQGVEHVLAATAAGEIKLLADSALLVVVKLLQSGLAGSDGDGMAAD